MEVNLIKHERRLLGIKEDSLWVEANDARTDDGQCFITVSQVEMEFSISSVAVKAMIGEQRHHHMVQRIDAGGFHLNPKKVSCSDYKFSIISLMSEGYEPRITGGADDSGLPEMRLANRKS
jgi:hypothetical protein